ncbi:MAG TPA: hypothetical protein VGS79_18275 [Puia sp.]|nr:hypothetical protein [Puia sp.]
MRLKKWQKWRFCPYEVKTELKKPKNKWIIGNGKLLEGDIKKSLIPSFWGILGVSAD